MAGSALSSLSYDLRPMLSERSISNIQQLRVEYTRKHPKRPPLFTIVTPGSERRNEYELPFRDYYWLRTWSAQDLPQTPIFWSHFSIPNQVVEYLALDGSEHACSSNDFYTLASPIYNRSEKADLHPKPVGGGGP